MEKENIAVIGYGYVGKAVTSFFAGRFHVIIYDPYLKNPHVEGVEDGTADFTTDKDKVNECGLAVICVSTPMSPDGSVDTSSVEEAVGWLKTPLILCKSTVPPGTIKRLSEKTGKNIAFSPEYIGEGKYVVQWWKDKGYPHPTDMKYHDFQIVGGKREITGKILEYFKRVLGPGPHYLQTDSTTAELVKYMENSWHAMKVTFCNEFYDIANAFGVDYEELRELFLMDGRMERSHTLVFENKRGFVGKCLPKDITGLVEASERAGYTPKLLKQMLSLNKEFTKKNEK